MEEFFNRIGQEESLILVDISTFVRQLYFIHGRSTIAMCVASSNSRLACMFGPSRFRGWIQCNAAGIVCNINASALTPKPFQTISIGKTYVRDRSDSACQR